MRTIWRRLAEAAAALKALCPLKVLERGYSVTRRAATGEVIRSAAQVQPDETIETLLQSGRLLSRATAESADL